MPGCFLDPDFPFRCQLLKGGVVHAVQERTRRWGTTMGLSSSKTTLHAACGEIGNQRRLKESIVDNTLDITCKNCQKAMGLIPVASPDQFRYVVVDTETNQYFKKGRYLCNNWADFVIDATLYKVKAAAVNHTKRLVWRDSRGNEVSKEDLKRVCNWKDRIDLGWRQNNEIDPRYQVKTVKISIE